MGVLLDSFYLPGKHCFEIFSGDITKGNVEAIVNAANKQLKHGGGLARIIVRNGGDVIQIESDAWVEEHGPISHKDPAFTSSGNLPCKYIIHAAGPVWGEGNEEKKLSDTIHGALALADRLQLTSIAFPAISTGIFGYPKDKAAHVFYNTIYSYFLKYSKTSINLVRLTLFDQTTINIFLDVFNNWKDKIEFHASNNI